jgi:hypothetical protein
MAAELWLTSWLETDMAPDRQTFSHTTNF